MFIQDVIARPIKHSDGTLDLSVWECIIPDKNKVKFETFIEILNLKFSSNRFCKGYHRSTADSCQWIAEFICVGMYHSRCESGKVRNLH